MKKYILEIDGFGIYIAKSQPATGVKTTTIRAKAMVFEQDCPVQKAAYYQALLARETNNIRLSVEAVQV